MGLFVWRSPPTVDGRTAVRIGVTKIYDGKWSYICLPLPMSDALVNTVFLSPMPHYLVVIFSE